MGKYRSKVASFVNSKTNSPQKRGEIWYVNHIENIILAINFDFSTCHTWGIIKININIQYPTSKCQSENIKTPKNYFYNNLN